MKKSIKAVENGISRWSATATTSTGTECSESRTIPITQIAYDRAVEFVEAPGFTALVSDYLDDDEYRGLQVFLAGKPDAGDVMSKEVIMAAKRGYVASKKRSLFREMMSGVQAMRDHREGRVTLKTKEVHPITVPPIDAETVRETREALNIRARCLRSRLA